MPASNEVAYNVQSLCTGGMAQREERSGRGEKKKKKKKKKGSVGWGKREGKVYYKLKLAFSKALPSFSLPSLSFHSILPRTARLKIPFENLTALISVETSLLLANIRDATVRELDATTNDIKARVNPINLIKGRRVENR